MFSSLAAEFILLSARQVAGGSGLGTNPARNGLIAG
jgi:hypothetical protein